MKKAFQDIVGGFASLVTGMRITITEFFKPTVTVHYPHQTLKIPPRFRGHIELVRDAETGKAICYACKLCERACPSDCITVDGVKLEGAKKKSVSLYQLDFTKCSLCGACVEACRDSAIRFSRDYNVAGLNKEDFIMDLFKKLEEEGKSEIRNPKAEGESARSEVPGPKTVAHSPVTSPSSPQEERKLSSPPNAGTQAEGQSCGDAQKSQTVTQNSK
jgi:NADH-quinone oxidoreductase subunit I